MRTYEQLQKLFPTATLSTWHQHPFGGGWVENTATVADTAYVGPDALVFENAQVFGNAWVFENAQVSDNALVYGNAQVSDNALVYGNARVYGNALVRGDACVFGNALVRGDARVYGNALVRGDAWVFGNAKITGTTRISQGIHKGLKPVLEEKSSEKVVLTSDMSKYPHTCLKCGAPAYIGVTRVECSKCGEY